MEDALKYDKKWQGKRNKINEKENACMKDLITEANNKNYDFCYIVTEISKKKVFHLDNRRRNHFGSIDNFF